MGVCYYSLRNFDEAIKAMTEALKYKPNHQIAHLNLGIVNLAAGNIDKSREWLQKSCPDRILKFEMQVNVHRNY